MTTLINTGAQAGNASFVAAGAIVQGATWGTAVAVGAGNGFAYTKESIVGGKAALPRQEVGFPFGQQPDVGAEMHKGAIDFDLMHGAGHGPLMSYFFGTQAASTQTGGGSSTTYLHKCTLQQSLTKFATIVLAKRAPTTKWWEYASCMARKLVLAGQGNARVTGQIEFLCNAMSRASSTNTVTQTDAVTVPARRGLVYAKQGTLRINAQAGGALGSVGTITANDVIPCLGFTFTAERPLAGDMLVDGTSYLAQPAEDGETLGTLEIVTRSYDAETWIDAYQAKTEYKADLKFLSGYTPASSAEEYTLLNMARMVVAEQPQATVVGRGRIQHNVKFNLLTPPSAPTGMTSLTTPFELQVLDEIVAAYLT